MNRKKSKVWRKELNQLRNMGDVPWPARRFRIAPTTSQPLITDRRCWSFAGIRRRRRPGWRWLIDLLLFRKPVVQKVLCGAPLVLIPKTARRNGRLECPRCSPIRRAFRRKAGHGAVRRAIRTLEHR